MRNYSPFFLLLSCLKQIAQIKSKFYAHIKASVVCWDMINEIIFIRFSHSPQRFVFLYFLASSIYVYWRLESVFHISSLLIILFLFCSLNVLDGWQRQPANASDILKQRVFENNLAILNSKQIIVLEVLEMISHYLANKAK